VVVSGKVSLLQILLPRRELALPNFLPLIEGQGSIDDHPFQVPTIPMYPRNPSTPSSLKRKGMAMRINPNYSLIERSPSPPVSTDNAAIIDMEPETEKATTEQPAPEVPAISPAQPSPPPPQIRLEDKPLTCAQREELQSIFKRMSLQLSPRLQKKARRRQQLNSIRAVIFFTVWLIQSSYVLRQVFKSLYRMIKAWVVKDCAKHAQKVAAAAAATADTKEAGNNVIWVCRLISFNTPKSKFID
jgi:hypothetical protein